MSLAKARNRRQKGGLGASLLFQVQDSLEPHRQQVLQGLCPGQNPCSQQQGACPEGARGLAGRVLSTVGQDAERFEGSRGKRVRDTGTRETLADGQG